MKRRKERIILSAAVTLSMICMLPVTAHAEEENTTECTHIHDENCGYIEGDEQSCQHVHDESCMVKKDEEPTKNTEKETSNEENSATKDNDSSNVALMNGNAKIASTYDLNSGSVVFDKDGTYSIAGVETPNTITVEKGKTVNLTIENIKITAHDVPAILVEAGATLNLTVEGTNNLKVDNRCAAISVEPGYNANNEFDLSTSATLNISGSGTLTTQGGDGDTSNSSYGGGAGIGGDGQ